MTRPVVHVENTPNPLVRKFSFGETLTDSPYEAGAHSALVPLLEAGAISVFVGTDYLSLSVGDADDWASVQPRAVAAIEEGAEALATMDVEHATVSEAPTDPVVAKIMEILDRNIRPAVARDGGDVKFLSFDDGVLMLEMKGACSGCPSSTATLKTGILNMMSYFVPEVRDVVAAEQ